MKAIFTAALIALTASFTKADPASGPVWLDQFEQSINNTFTYPYLGSSSTNATFHYDYTNKQYRINRDNGKWDRYCGTVYKFRNTPCDHIVVEGVRYLYFPEHDYCCNCCSDEHGCGILKPDWAKGAEFIGYEDNGDTQKWDMKGLQSNFIWVRNADGQVTRILQQPNEDQVYLPETFSRGIQDPSVFNLPSSCSSDYKCPWISTCTLVRHAGANSEALKFLLGEDQ